MAFLPMPKETNPWEEMSALSWQSCCLSLCGWGKQEDFSHFRLSVFTFLEQVREMFPFPALHSGFCWGFPMGLDAGSALLPLHTR